MASQLARNKAGEAWTKPTTKNMDMNPDLAEAFAEILDEVLSKPWLGNATTRTLLEEIKVRIEIDGNLDSRPVDE